MTYLVSFLLPFCKGTPDWPRSAVSSSVTDDSITVFLPTMSAKYGVVEFNITMRAPGELWQPAFDKPLTAAKDFFTVSGLLPDTVYEFQLVGIREDAPPTAASRVLVAKTLQQGQLVCLCLCGSICRSKQRCQTQ